MEVTVENGQACLRSAAAVAGAPRIAAVYDNARHDGDVADRRKIAVADFGAHGVPGEIFRANGDRANGARYLGHRILSGGDVDQGKAVVFMHRVAKNEYAADQRHVAGGGDVGRFDRSGRHGDIADVDRGRIQDTGDRLEGAVVNADAIGVPAADRDISD